jgi:hypothetical protein
VTANHYDDLIAGSHAGGGTLAWWLAPAGFAEVGPEALVT